MANRACARLDLTPEVSGALPALPHEHRSKSVPTDAVIYRFHEMMNVYGETIKELIHEEFGDGLMSAIDFTMDTMDIGRQPDPAQ